jgi:hypothetical protein
MKMVGPEWKKHSGPNCPVTPTDQVSVIKERKWLFGLFTDRSRIEQIQADHISWDDVISYCNWSDWDRKRERSP